MARSDGSTEAQPASVEFIRIRKTFPGVVANDDVSIVAYPSEVLCLLGENGAGKSTLMSILSGFYTPDAGVIRVNGADVIIDSPKRARDLGIGMVHQHLSIVPTLTVLENLMVATGKGFRLDVVAAQHRLKQLEQTLGIDIAGDARAETLSLGELQQIEIMKALWRESRVLILDEPTSMLTERGIEELKSVLIQLKSSGLSIIFITHKLHEALAIGDRVAVLKHGRVVGALGPRELRDVPQRELERIVMRMMFPDQSVDPFAMVRQNGPGAAGDATGDAFLQLRDASTSPTRGGCHLKDVSITVGASEVLGIAGIDGNGQRELAEVICGQRATTSGQVLLEGRDITRLRVPERQRLGVRYVTDDRLGEGIIRPFGIGMNLVLKRLGMPPFWRHLITDEAAIDMAANRLIREFDVRTPSARTRVGVLSGGNLQKVILARELSFEPRLIVYNKPTHGLDVMTSIAIRNRILQQAAAGTASIVISTDTAELLQLCSRVAVMRRGTIADVVDVGPNAEERITELILEAGRSRAIN